MRNSHIVLFASALFGRSAQRPCEARASVKLLVDQSSLSGAISDGISGAGLATASDLTTLEGRVSTAESSLSTVSSDLASKANSSDLAAKADASDLTALDTAVKAAAGKPFSALETLTGAGGTDKFGSPWTMPYSLVSGDYEIDAIFTMTDGATKLGTVSQVGWKGRYDAAANGGDGGWSELQEAQTSYKVESGTVDSGTGFFGNPAHLPGMDVSPDSGNLSTVARPRNGQSVTIAVDGKVRSLGVNVD